MQSLHRQGARLALVGAVAGTLALGALAGPALAAGDDGSSAPQMRKAPGERPAAVDGDHGGTASIIAI